MLHWGQNDCWPSEPVFVPRPDAKEEDDGKIMKCSESWGYMSFVLNLISFSVLSQESWVDISTLRWGYLFCLVKFHVSNSSFVCHRCCSDLCRED